MVSMHGVPELLRLITEGDDDQMVMTGACRWVARQVEGAVVGVVVAGGGHALVGAAGLAAVLSAEERLALAGASPPERRVRPDSVLVVAPIRYAGVDLARLVCVGPAAQADDLHLAARNAAVVCGPVVRSRLDALSMRRDSHVRVPELVGRSPSIVALREAVVRAASSSFAVVIEGESGSGKELVARAVHRLSARRDHRFAAINCAALVDELAEAELFGHARGAFTGAVVSRVGLFEEAHLGTLFLDEVAELSPRTQAKLLRVLQEREVRRLGENQARGVDVRLVSATNRSLADMVHDGDFRADLLFRLAVIRIQVPPLRERAEDVPVLAISCWQALVERHPTRAVLGPDALARLARHTWPGNVRELQNVVAGLIVNAPVRGRVSARHVEHVLGSAGGQPSAASLLQARLACERRTVANALARHGGRRMAAARELGLSRQGLAKAIRRLGIGQSGPIEGVA